MVRRFLPRTARWLSNIVWSSASVSLTSALGYAVYLERSGQPIMPGTAVPLFLVGVSALLGFLWPRGLRRHSRPVLSTLEFGEKPTIIRADTGQSIPIGEFRSVLRDDQTLWLTDSQGMLLSIHIGHSEEAKSLAKPFERGVFEVERQAPPRLRFFLATFGALTIAGLTMVLAGVLNDQGLITVYAAAQLSLWAATVRRSKRVAVGIDGISIGGNFLAFRDIQQITSHRNRVVIVHPDGSQKTYPVTMDPSFARALNSALRSQIESDVVDDGGVFDRQRGETNAEWMTRLRGVLSAQSFRTSGVTKESAKELLQGPKAALRIRVAVAIAIAATAPEYVQETLEDMCDGQLKKLTVSALEADELLEGF